MNLPAALTDILPGNEAGLQRLGKLLAIKQGFQFYVLVCADPQERDRLIRHLDDLPALAARSVLRVDLAEHGPSADPPTDVAALEDRLHAETAENALVHLVNGDGWLSPERIADLNLHRNALAARVPASLLWWLPESTVTALARGAPDVWSWRTGVVAFEGSVGASQVGQPVQVPALVPQNRLDLSRLSKADKEARLAELAEAISRLASVELKRHLLLERADLLHGLGRLDEALGVLRNEALPLAEEGTRFEAVAKGRIADILAIRGELDEALRILRTEVQTAFETLGDAHLKAVARGKIADILMARGELDKALRIYTEEQLPVYEKLGNVREKAVTQGKIADILKARGELDEALRIHTEEQLPVFEKLGDVRSKAVTQGKIADILMERGRLDEALRIRSEEELPVYEKLGDLRALLVTHANIAALLHTRNAPGDRTEARRLLDLALADARRLQLPREIAAIESWLAQLDAPA